MKEVYGDLVKQADEFDVVIHGCNCMNTMGGGIAVALRVAYPGIYDADTIAYKAGKVRLGNMSIHFEPSINTTFVNCYTQHDFKGRKTGKRDVDYFAIKECMQKVKKRFSGMKIGIPLIGCGLAGGDWNLVSTIIDEELLGEDVTLVKIKD